MTAFYWHYTIPLLERIRPGFTVHGIALTIQGGDGSVRGNGVHRLGGLVRQSRVTGGLIQLAGSRWGEVDYYVVFGRSATVAVDEWSDDTSSGDRNVQRKLDHCWCF